MHGEPALPANFAHLPYANPDAPKGGRITYANVGTFDSMNPFIVMGTSPRGLWDETYGRNVWESLLTRNRAEPFSLYGLLAGSVDVAPDRSWVEFQIRPEAKFADGEPVKPEDVIFTVELLRERGRPPTRPLLRRAVERVEKVGERGVRFTFNGGGDRELPMLIGLMVILPKHAIDPATFDKTTLTPPLGSGAYRVEQVDAGRSVTLKRREDYWGKDLPIKRGLDNYDEIRVEYFRDAGSYFEAFKKGLFDVLPESDPARWATKYDFPAIQEGRVALETFPTATPKPMVGFVYNTRRPAFADPKVREALTYCLDFEWLNRALYSGLYQRSGSYFQGSELSALGQPAGEAERALLAPYAASVRPEVMDGSYRPPVSDGSGTDRANLRKGFELLTSAGYERRGGVLVNAQTGETLTFEMLVRDQEEENLALAYQRTCALIGAQVSVRRVEAQQYELRIKSFDFDMIRFAYPSSLSPGGEQLNRWSSQAAENQGSFNFSGAHDPAIDAMIAALLAATSREDFVAAVRALDRVLISGFYLVPLFHAPEDWWARWTRIEHPATPSLYGAEPTSWWAAP
ncbi:MAG: ABC transporter substrate-binding protein [Rhizobiales bacterium]|nr:ABC transporter substrate-binding protein [Hyphomicrobiales bacterium]